MGTVLWFLMGTRTRLESACRNIAHIINIYKNVESVHIAFCLEFPFRSALFVFPTNVDQVTKTGCFCCLKPN